MHVTRRTHAYEHDPTLAGAAAPTAGHGHSHGGAPCGHSHEGFALPPGMTPEMLQAMLAARMQG